MKSMQSVSDDSDFEKLLQRLSDDILSAPALLRMDKELSECFNKYGDAVAQAQFFWGMVAGAVRETALMRLCRIYDQESNALGLRKLLLEIEGNKHLFEDASVKKRVNAAFANSIKPGSHVPKPEAIQKDLALVSPSDPLVNKLLIWRGNFGAHISAKLTIKNNLRDEKLLTQDDAFALGDRALGIFNHYRTLFQAVSHSSKYLNEVGSLEAVFKYVRARLSARRKARDEVTERLVNAMNASKNE